MTAEFALARYEINRRADERIRPGLIDALLALPDTRVLVVAGGVEVTGHELVFAAPDAVTRHSGDIAAFLGRDGSGAAVVALLRPAALTPNAARLANLRDVGADLPADQAAWATAATALAAWHARSPRCTLCGAATEVVQAGWARRCPGDGTEHYPRTDPAVIMRVLDDDDRLLLGRARHFPSRRFSLLAGFVEAGESLEAAVRREVLEEVGIGVGNVTYVGSQPWPFPGSIMAGFDARALGTQIAFGDDELAEAQWFTRAELRRVAGVSIHMPPRTSIARSLIEDWMGEPLER